MAAVDKVVSKNFTLSTTGNTTTTTNPIVPTTFISTASPSARFGWLVIGPISANKVFIKFGASDDWIEVTTAANQMGYNVAFGAVEFYLKTDTGAPVVGVVVGIEDK